VFNLINFFHIIFILNGLFRNVKSVYVLLYFSHTILDSHTAGRMLKLIHCAVTVPNTHILCDVMVRVECHQEFLYPISVYFLYWYDDQGKIMSCKLYSNCGTVNLLFKFCSSQLPNEFLLNSLVVLSLLYVGEI
jgi:hypothetical protein